jgi:signal peptidase
MHTITPDRTAVRTAAVLVVLVLLAPFVVFAVPGLVGASHGYVVLSDSMEPTFGAGDAVLVTETAPEAVEAGDVVTYRRGGASGTLVTHRVHAVVEDGDGLQFRTKGDANEEVDGELVAADELVGVRTHTVPYLGHAILFARSRLGIAALVVVPSLLLAVGEARDLLGRYRAGADDATSDTGAP